MLATQSQTTVTILMMVGAVFAAAGLLLLLRPKAAAEAAKIDVLGIKIESSSAGLLVFLIGAAFIAVPLFVEVRAPEASRGGPPADIQRQCAAGKDGLSGPAEASATGAAQRIEESEPNDWPPAANPLAFGQVVSGEGDWKEPPDWFAIDLPAEGLAGIQIKLRHASGHRVTADVYDSADRAIGRLSSGNGAEYLTIEETLAGRMTVKVGFLTFDGAYELTVQPPAPEASND